jgi:hypothetical protein
MESLVVNAGAVGMVKADAPARRVVRIASFMMIMYIDEEAEEVG